MLPPEDENHLEKLPQGLSKANWYVELITDYDIPDEAELVAAKTLSTQIHEELKRWNVELEKRVEDRAAMLYDDSPFSRGVRNAKSS